MTDVADRVEVWTEDRVKALLARYGLKTPAAMLLRPGDDVSRVSLPYPHCVKVCSPSILHKSDVGGVLLDLRDRADLIAAVEEMRLRFPGRDVLVEAMEEKGVEVIVGALLDASFGPTIMLGLGGTLAELYQDVTFRLVPITRSDAESMLEDLRGRALLEGFRGIEVDRASLVDVLLAVSRLAESLGSALFQLDLNPVFARAHDAVVVDAKLVVRAGAGSDVEERSPSWATSR
jgi:ATP-grasp domain-containing protein